MRALLRAIWRWVRNPTISTLNDDGSIHETWQPDRSEQWAISSPSWLATAFTRKLPCGCTQRRVTGRITLYLWGCETHPLLDTP